MAAKRKPPTTPLDRDSNSQRRRSFIKAAYLRLEIWPETPILPSCYFLGVDYRCNDGVLKRIAYTITPYTTVIRLLGVVQNPANGFPARPLAPIYWRRFRYSAHLRSTLTT